MDARVSSEAMKKLFTLGPQYHGAAGGSFRGRQRKKDGDPTNVFPCIFVEPLVDFLSGGEPPF